MSNKMKVKEFFRNLSRDWQLAIMLVPAIAFFGVFCYYPMYGLLIAFKDFSITKGIMGSPWLDLSISNSFLKVHICGD